MDNAPKETGYIHTPWGYQLHQAKDMPLLLVERGLEVVQQQNMWIVYGRQPKGWLKRLLGL